MWMKTKNGKIITLNIEDLMNKIVVLTAYEVVNLFNPASIFLIQNGYNEFTVQ